MAKSLSGKKRINGMGLTGLTCILTVFLFALSAVSFAASPKEAWPQAKGSRQWSFPRDHGSHPGFRTEWWYFTGNLTDRAGNRYGYQLTFFRHGLRAQPGDPSNPWSLRDVYLAHFTITDVKRRLFRFAEKTSRKGPGLAGAEEGRMDVKLLNWSAVMKGDRIALEARGPGMELVLDLTPLKPPVLHGSKGLSAKGPKEGQASWYYSLPNLRTNGSLKVAGGERVDVSGTSWFDHEFGSNQLGPEQAGWDWMSLHLSDGRELMIYLMRKKDGTLEPASSGTLVEKDGSARHLTLEEIRVDTRGTWKSPKSGGVYPAQWRIAIPKERIDVAVSPLLPDQELTTGKSTGVTYWEGAAGGTGRSGGREVSVEGYIELTGYAGSLGGIF